MNPGGCYGEMARDTYGQSELWPKNFITFDIWSLILKKKNGVTLIQINLDIIPITISKVILWFFQNYFVTRKKYLQFNFSRHNFTTEHQKSYSIRLIHTDTNPRKDDVLNVIFFSDKTLRRSTTTMLEKFFSGKQKNTSSNCKWWIATQKINLSRLIITWKHVNFQIS